MFKLNFRNQVLAGFAISILLVLIVGVLSFNSIKQLEDDTVWVNHTQKVIKTSNNLLQYLIDGETGMRGYGATNNKQFLDPYNDAVPKITESLMQLSNLVVDNPAQLKRIDSLKTIVNRQLVILKTNIDTREAKGLDYMVARHMFLNGKGNMDSIRDINKRVIDTENNLLEERKAASERASERAVIVIVIGCMVFVLIVVIMFYYIQATFARQKKIEEEVRVANLQLEKVLVENESKNWLLTGSGNLNERMQGQQSEKELSENILTEVSQYANALTGTLYLFDDNEERLELYASYAFNDPAMLKQTIRISEGWIGQAAKDERAAVVKGKLNDRLLLGTSILEDELIETFIVPFFFDKKLKGVIELGFRSEITDQIKEYILLVANDIGIAVNTSQARTIMHDLFEETQQQAEELEAQQEEMRVTNEELMNKTEMLQASEEELRVQQEELRTINAELEEKASLLEEKNQAIEEARQSISIKANELETTGRYKSEFLANMSHELRTPLNSILVLARILKDNKPLNLSEDQIKYASVIFNAGNDLLTLINDILDLSKIESGKLDMQNENVKVADILSDMQSLFAEVAGNKQINYSTSYNGVPPTIYTDKVRVEQVIKNLLSNAFKFTPENGSISIAAVAGPRENTISFKIKDSGIGIPSEKQKIIFEAFQQADGSTSRKYGGTGLGLSISRELASLLGGNITVTSQPGAGSEFTLTLPFEAKHVDNAEETLPTIENYQPTTFLDTVVKKSTDPNHEPFVIIVEDDKNFADILQDYARDHGFKSVMVNEGTNAVEIITEQQPDAVILDIMLPGKDGWQILKELKQAEATMHIPVHLMSAGEAAANRVRKEGAISFLKKPVNTETLDKLFADIMANNGTKFTQILLVEDHKAQSQALKDLMQSQGITVDQAFDGESAFRMLYEKEYQCVILDLNLPDISGLDLLDKIKEIDKFISLPVIINTAMELDKTSVNRLMQYANAMVVKTSKSSDRLIDEVNLFLNKISESGPKSTAPGAPVKGKNITKGKETIKGKKVLIVDDDMRNIFALSSALESYDLNVVIANDGEEAIAKLEEVTDIDIVLMDIMMPKMDGYEATRHIRKQNKWAKLPVIALTAKAMKDDREKCIAAGANDYITKPVDIDRLIALMQLWLDS
ncbi:hybrid sensor histidine kinase/response regulator [Mucilaginibacter phyllosphaerae]|uniref:histidine kinase n=1 Tax=Mucilaginibacter phyllosphaerae TaxID=1812349 RepID=A0A4Y8AHU8_9SPHI|nr:response regulator [Mucilaginibacter phyllosphaerae]MBB3968343.1 CheY-like chemotaxis protein/CHASE3 domain sensor protein [Mucilaginibacter phyllosphaerae]TEW68658.1 response regulator [Mucilaginibacter phyllosphaerae]GGG99593.1 two-component system sensor histidine kinase/response regulator [Mucilaginibacter phyllosphaerae]